MNFILVTLGPGFPFWIGVREHFFNIIFLNVVWIVIVVDGLRDNLLDWFWIENDVSIFPVASIRPIHQIPWILYCYRCFVVVHWTWDVVDRGSSWRRISVLHVAAAPIRRCY